MSGRRLGRLFGPLLVLTALAAIGFVVGGPVTDFQTADIIWTARPGSAVVDSGR